MENSNGYYQTSLLIKFKHLDLQRKYISFLKSRKLNIYIIISFFIVALSAIPIIFQFRVFHDDNYGILWRLFTIIVLIQVAICMSGIIFIETIYNRFYSNQLTNQTKQKVENLREKLLIINNILSPIGMGLNVYLRVNVECEHNVSLLDSQFCNGNYNNKTIPIDCFISFITITILHQIIFPIRFEYTIIVWIIGFLFFSVSAIKAYYHHKVYQSQDIAFNSILFICYLVMILFQGWVQKSNLNEFVLQDGLDTMMTLHRRRRQMASNSINGTYVDFDDQTLTNEIFYHNSQPIHYEQNDYINDMRSDNRSDISSLSLEY